MKHKGFGRKLFSEGLLFQVTGLALLISTVILTLFGWQRIQQHTENLKTNLQTSLDAYSQWLATAVELPLYNFDDETVSALCRSMIEQPDIVLITITANTQRRIFRDEEYFKAIPPKPETISIVDEIVHGGVRLGEVEVMASTQSLQQEIRWASLSTVLQIVILDLFLVLSIVFFLSRKFIRPVEQLQDVAGRIAGGVLTDPIEIKGRNELGQLADNLETMRKTLQEKISALEFEVNIRSKTEEDLSAAKNYIDNIINSMPSLLIGVDSQNRITNWNRKAEEVTGISSDLAKARNLQDVFPYLNDITDRITEAMTMGTPVFENARVTMYGSTKRYEDITIYPLKVKGIEGAVIRIDDITKQHLMQEELTHSRKLDAIGQLAGGVAHDFNNMLGGILGGAEMLEMHLGDDEKGKKYLNLIMESGRRATELNRKLLAFARRDKVESAPVDVAKAVEVTIDILRHSLDKLINITMEMNTQDTVVMGDLSQLQNALINLGINAGHAIAESGELRYRVNRIELSSVYCSSSPFDIEPGHYVDIEIRDTGQGIPLEYQHQIFDPFFTTKEQGKGTGLGLASVYGTVQQHHGAITLYSEVGIGTTFHIYLPLANQQIRVEQKKDDRIISGSGRVLIVEDESVIRLTASAMLESLGYEVIVAENGQQAIEIFSKKADEIELVLMDMIMPEMNGRECFFAMKEISSGVKVVLASGFSKDADIEELKTCGLCGFLRKPYSIAELSRAVAMALN